MFTALKNFYISRSRLEQCMRLFYITMLVTTSFKFVHFLLHINLEKASWVWPVWWLRYVHPEIAISILLVLMIVFLLSAAIYPFSRWIKATAATLCFLMVATFFSFGHISHGYHGGLFAAFFLAFIGDRKSNFLFHRIELKYFFCCAQIAFLGTYFLSGIWKLRNSIGFMLDSGSREFFDPFKYAIALRFLNTQEMSPQIQYLLDLPMWLSRTLWVPLVCFEIFCLFLAFLPKAQRVGGLMIILLHLSVFVVMGIKFTTPALLAAVLIVANPYRPMSELDQRGAQDAA